MHNSEARRRKERQKEQIKQRYNVVIDPENYEYIPAKKQADYYDNDVNQRVAIYVRVSTDDVRQTTSYPDRRHLSPPGSIPRMCLC